MTIGFISHGYVVPFTSWFPFCFLFFLHSQLTNYMRIKYSLATIPFISGMIAIFLYSCSHSYVALEYTNAKGEVPQLGNLIFRFNKSLYPDSLINNWDSTRYISFEPSIPGRFRWNGPDELVFSPAQPLLPATTYKASLKQDILRYSKFNDVKDGDKIEFHTPDLQLNDAAVTWVVPEDAHGPVPQLRLQFNYPVHVEDLKDKLNILVDGSKSDYTIQTTGNSEDVSVRLPSYKEEDRNYDTRIVIGKGIKPSQGNNSTAEEMSA